MIIADLQLFSSYDSYRTQYLKSVSFFLVEGLRSHRRVSATHEQQVNAQVAAATVE